MHQLLTFAVGVTSFAMTVAALGSVWEWPCIVAGGALGGWCAVELWFGGDDGQA